MAYNSSETGPAAGPNTEKNPDPLVSPPASRPRHMLLYGVAVACVLGGGLGLWARPALGERSAALAAPPPDADEPATAAPHRELKIVVTDAPPPPAEPIAVMPAPSMPGKGDAVPAAAIHSPPDMLAPEPLAPVRPVQEVVKVVAPAPLPVVVAPKAVVRPAPAPMAAKLTPAKAPAAPPKPAPLVKVSAPAKSPPKLIRKAEPAPAKPAAKAKLQLAKAETRRPVARIEVKAPARPARSVKSLVRALVHGPARIEARLEKVRMVTPPKAPPRKAKPAKAEKAAAPKPTARKAPPKLTHASRPAHMAPPPMPRPVGLMKVANTSRCALSDPGAAVVCLNPSLGAADRQLARAYRDAQAAGVPNSQLQRQQDRWLAARAAAAREAPWAVHDVYQARIAELNGMARDAAGSN